MTYFTIEKQINVDEWGYPETPEELERLNNYLPSGYFYVKRVWKADDVEYQLLQRHAGYRDE